MNNPHVTDNLMAGTTLLIPGERKGDPEEQGISISQAQSAADFLVIDHYQQEKDQQVDAFDSEETKASASKSGEEMHEIARPDGVKKQEKP